MTTHNPSIWFYLSLFFSRLADQVLLFLVPLVVFQTTQSAAWAGVAFFVETLPRFLAFAVCGALCDRYALVKLLHISQLWRALVCVAGSGLFLMAGGVGWLVAVSAVCGVLTTQGMMAREVMLPQIFKGQRMESVLAKVQIADQLGMVLGPLLAALALQVVPWPWVVVSTAGLFLMADGFAWVWDRLAKVTFNPPKDANAGRGWHLVAPIKTALLQVWRLPGLRRLIVLAAGVNLVIGVTLATSAAMVTGLLHRTADDYALLQAAGAVVTVLILGLIVRTRLPLAVLGWLSYGCIFAGGLATAFGSEVWVYALGFLAVVGFDKMFSVYIRTRRQMIIPPGDLGKTTGVIVLLNNLTQPLAGLLVGIGAGSVGLTGALPAVALNHIIFGLVAVMGAIGVVVAFKERR